MKIVFCLVFFVLAVTAVPLAEVERINGINGWYIPQINGSNVWVTLEEGEQMLADYEQQDNEDIDENFEESVNADEYDNELIMNRMSTVPIKFYLYTNKNPTKGQKLYDNNKAIKNSDFNAKNPTKFITHGWAQSYTSGMCKDIRTAWLTQGKYNVIVVDWARARSVDYVSSVVAVPKVGKKIASMIDYLVENHGLNLDETEMIGHGLGAHVAGITGKKLKNGMLHSIISLDAALSLYSYKKPEKRVSATDAHYVESIHTNGDQNGFLEPIGKSAFYPNGGKKQPGCALDLTGACDHARSVAYYVEAVVRNSFPSMRCVDYKAAVKHNCGGSYSGVRMGAQYNAYVATGEFYVPVHSSSPYGYGYGA
ncbi:phospholipase A1 VesT1.02-like [Eurosta solidaginis]|uniref:phospholipase A1 VesT1.02-like n=1 Tax=Eurosta solidaginis TaxID=178769 RepID=UPI003530FE57